mgnify:CR=1 FL=1
MNLIILLIIIIFFVQSIELFLFKNDNNKGEIYSKWSIFAFSSSYILLIISSIVEYLAMSKKINFTVTTIGFFMINLRFFIKYWAFKSLGECWSVHVQIKGDHKLIKQGPYRFLRHPVYLSRIINIIGIPLITNSYYTLFGFLPINLFLIFFRIYKEEKLLTKKFGEEYIRYKEETYKLIPLIF